MKPPKRSATVVLRYPDDVAMNTRDVNDLIEGGLTRRWDAALRSRVGAWLQHPWEDADSQVQGLRACGVDVHTPETLETAAAGVTLALLPGRADALDRLSLHLYRMETYSNAAEGADAETAEEAWAARMAAMNAHAAQALIAYLGALGAEVQDR